MPGKINHLFLRLVTGDQNNRNVLFLFLSPATRTGNAACFFWFGVNVLEVSR